MTIEPAWTRANRINSVSLDGSYIGFSFSAEHSTKAACAAPIHGAFSFGARTNGRGRPALRSPGRVHLGGPLLSPRWIAAKKSFTVRTFSSVLIQILHLIGTRSTRSCAPHHR